MREKIFSSIKMHNLLGQGAYGKVVNKNGKAVKSFAKLSHVIQEYVALKYLNDSKYVVKASKVDFSRKLIYMKLYDDNLNNWLFKNEESSKMSNINKITKDILKGLIELHDRGLTHGDLKPGNILIREKPLGAVLGDCGFVSISKYAKVERTARVYRDLVVKHSSKHDIYSFGMIYFMLITGVKYIRPPKDYEEMKDLVKYKIKDNKIRKLITSCLHPEHKKRPTARNILYELFGESPPQWERNKIEIFGKDSEDDDIKKNLVSLCKKYELNRYGKGCEALGHFLIENNIPDKEHKLYLSCTLLILSSVFGKSSKFAKNNASNVCNYKFTEEEIFFALERLCENEDYVKIIMSK